MRSLRFGLRGLLSLMTGLAFVGFVANWLLSQRGDGDPPWTALLLVIPWAIGSLASGARVQIEHLQNGIGALNDGIS
jgi:hypothetical protein